MSKSVLSAAHFHEEPAALAFIEARLWVVSQFDYVPIAPPVKHPI